MKRCHFGQNAILQILRPPQFHVLKGNLCQTYQVCLHCNAGKKIQFKKPKPNTLMVHAKASKND
jgi:hypothetical protein